MLLSSCSAEEAKKMKQPKTTQQWKKKSADFLGQDGCPCQKRTKTSYHLATYVKTLPPLVANVSGTVRICRLTRKQEHFIVLVRIWTLMAECCVKVHTDAHVT